MTCESWRKREREGGRREREREWGMEGEGGREREGGEGGEGGIEGKRMGYGGGAGERE